MLCFYAVSRAGRSHRAGGLPCQDSFCAARLAGGTMAVAVADGLGSAPFSHLGSAAASHGAVWGAARALASCPRDLRGAAQAALAAAAQAVAQRCAHDQLGAEDLDTTLCAAVFDGSRLAWGQAGDSGLLVCHDDGGYRCPTRQDRDEEGRVFPLCFEERWSFGEEKNVASLVLATDGVLECLAPPVLAAQGREPVDTRLARMFLHPQPDDALRLRQVEAEAAAYFLGFPTGLLDDDVTLVAVFDDQRRPAEREAAYYAGPCWEEVSAEAKAALYR